MKKLSTILLLAACAAVLTACGGSKAENVETEAGTAAAATIGVSDQVETDASGQITALPEDYEPEYMEGILTDIADNTLTVEDEDGTSLKFDITYAENYDPEFLMSGAYVEVVYAIVDGDVYPAESVAVLMDIEEQADIEDRDPVIYGIVQLMDINDLVIIDETGTERAFDNQMSRTVSFSDIKAGDTVQVTYTGNLLEDDDVKTTGLKIEAIKIVAEDAIGSDEANANYITGTVDVIYTDVLTLITEPTTFEVLIDESMVEGIEEDDTVKVYYEGSISGISVTATDIEAVEE